MPKAEILRALQFAATVLVKWGWGVGGKPQSQAQISRASFLSPLPVPPPHSSPFPFWSPTLFPKFLAWESRCQGPYWLLPSSQVCFLTCKLRMR